ncbi:hypothetical protein ACFFYR_36040 [Paraburkholderia dipogonis]|nr:hypothetical protein [Paraburkholderia dipogonis]
MMRRIHDARQQFRRALLATTAVVVFTLTTSGFAAADDAKSFVDAQKPGGTVKLYSAPGEKEGVMDAPTLPLAVDGPSEHGFYPVKVNGKSYWVDGMSVKVVRNAQIARCSESAGVQSAATLGAASNRCH